MTVVVMKLTLFSLIIRSVPLRLSEYRFLVQPSLLLVLLKEGCRKEMTAIISVFQNWRSFLRTPLPYRAKQFCEAKPRV